MSFTTKSLLTLVTLYVPLKDLPSLRVYERQKKISTYRVAHQSITSTEVSELPIPLQKDIHSYTQYPIIL